MTLVIDGTTYAVPLTVVNRKAEILYKFAERTADGVLHSEPIGTFYNFDVECGMSKNNVTDYAALWIKLSEPVSSHTITLPTESGDFTFDCYFSGMKDEHYKQKGGVNYFRRLSFSVIAISPAVVA